MAKTKAKTRTQKRIPRSLDSSHMAEIKSAMKRVDASLHGRFIAYGPAKSYANTLEKFGRELGTSPTQLVYDKQTGRIMHGRKALSVLEKASPGQKARIATTA